APLGLAIDVATVAAVGFTLAAAFAHRWDYRLSPRDLALGGGLAVLIAAATEAADGAAAHLVGGGLGVVQGAAGVPLGPSRSRDLGFRGERLLSGLLTLWGFHRIAMQVTSVEPGTPAYLAMHATFVTLYFLSTFAVIIMVLERARSESERLQTRLREAERLATAGELAASMAHEIRNPLAAILNATALLA